MKQKLDERQMQEAAKIASISFYVMYGVCAAFLKAQSFPPCLQYSMYLLSEEKPDQRQKISTAVLLFFYRDHGSLLLHTETYRIHEREETQTTGTKNI